MRCLAARLGLLLVALSGCNFEDGMKPGIDVNTCTGDADCGSEGRCDEGMCVARNVEEGLEVVLEVTPTRVPDGMGLAPIRLGSFDVEGAVDREWQLPLPVRVTGSVMDGDDAIAAEVRFAPVASTGGMATQAITVATGEAGEVEVHLLDDVMYDAMVLPNDKTLPPVHMTFTAAADAKLDVRYDDLALREQTFAFDGGPADRTLLVRALHRESGEVISSTAMVEDGKATLLFAPGAVPYRLEVSVATSDEPEPSTLCDTSTALHPTFMIDDDEINAGQVNIDVLNLPAAPRRIRYEGTVQLCPRGSSYTGDLPMTLRATSLAFRDETPFTGTFRATTVVVFDNDAHEHRFCVELLEGEYEVVVTPPSDLSCTIFAEQRLVKAPPNDGSASTGALLRMPTTTYLAGEVRAADGMPLARATLEARALGRAAEAANRDAVLLRYNRSRSTTTDEVGEFELPVDPGSYDVVIKPPAESGFPWRVVRDVEVSVNADRMERVIEVAPPVQIRGTLEYPDAASDVMETLEDAQVRAFALVEDVTGTERLIAVGTADADAEGKFVLLLSPSLPEGW